MQVARSLLPEMGKELTSNDGQPLSPATQRAIHRKRDVIVTIHGREPKKGKIALHPRQTVAELLGAREATKLIGSQKMQINTVAVVVPDEIYMSMSKILKEVRQVVSSLPMREVKQSILDAEVLKLAAAAYPDPSQHQLRMNYVRAANGLLNQILEDHDKVIQEVCFRQVPTEETLPVPELNGNTFPVSGNNVDVDNNAHLFPLS